MKEVLAAAAAAGITAVIATDQAAILAAREAGIEVHLSTQLNISNSGAVKFYSEWADVVVLSRELNLQQVKKIHDSIVSDDIRGPGGELIKLEMFVHGALCMAVSENAISACMSTTPPPTGETATRPAAGDTLSETGRQVMSSTLTTSISCHPKTSAQSDSLTS
jgi:collagenase-like PrtC family protease